VASNQCCSRSTMRRHGANENLPPIQGFPRFRARKPALICGRCLVGGSATRRDFAWCPMALYGQLRRLFWTSTSWAGRLF
jgi:hypothetical protein